MTDLPLSDPAHPFHLTEADSAALDAEIEARADRLAAETVLHINGARWMRSRIVQAADRNFVVHDTFDAKAEEDQRVCATIHFNDGGECWEVTLKGTDIHIEGPGNRGFRDFDGAAFYAEAWLWELDGDF